MQRGSRRLMLGGSRGPTATLCSRDASCRSPTRLTFAVSDSSPARHFAFASHAQTSRVGIKNR